MDLVRILFTGVGRRIELVQAFRQAALCLNKKVVIYGADMAGTAPALAYCDEVRKVCAMKDKEYIAQLLSICQNDRINILIPTIDTDLLALSEHKTEFEEIGTRVLISSPEMIRICRDKNNTGAFFESCGLNAPKTYNDYTKYDGAFPCFIKPKDGSSSINAYKVEDGKELKMYAEMVDDYVIQPFIDGNEYTVDIFCDFEGKPIYITPRERLQVRAGEVLKTSILLDAKMIEESRCIVEKFRPCGPITVQLIQDKVTKQNYYIEINPRYGGGAPLSIKAGAKSPEALLRLICGESLDGLSKEISDESVYSRFDQSVCINFGNENQKLCGVIFDLDDTLYSEKDYVYSGFSAVAEYLGDAAIADWLYQHFEQGKPAINEYLNDVCMIDKKERCVEIYRQHMPTISLYAGVRNLLSNLRDKAIRLAIITDGRVEGQKNKIEALGLSELVDDIVITDELGGVQFRKPNDISYRIIQNRWRLPFEQIIYIGDNPTKDFIAPAQLGMRSLYYRNDNGLYSHSDCNRVPTVGSIKEMSDYIFQRID